MSIRRVWQWMLLGSLVGLISVGIAVGAWLSMEQRQLDSAKQWRAIYDESVKLQSMVDNAGHSPDVSQLKQSRYRLNQLRSALNALPRNENLYFQLALIQQEQSVVLSQLALWEKEMVGNSQAPAPPALLLAMNTWVTDLRVVQARWEASWRYDNRWPILALCVTLLLFACLLVFLSTMLRQRILMSLGMLIEAVDDIESGQLNVSISDAGFDEMATLAMRLDKLRHTLSTQHADHLAIVNAAQKSENQLRLFLDQVPAAFAVFDCDMHYLAVSRRWLKDYGLENLNVIGLSHYEVFPEIPEHWKKIHRRGVGGEVVTCEEEKFVRQDGTVQWLRWEVRPWVAGENCIGGTVIFTEDITRLVDAREAATRYGDKLRYLTEVVGQISATHEISDLARIVCRSVRELTGADGVSLALSDEGTCCYLEEDAMEPLWKGQCFPLESCVPGWAILHVRNLVIGDIFIDPRAVSESSHKTFVKSLSAVPVGREKPMAAITCYWSRQHQATVEELELQQAVADAMFASLSHRRLFEEMATARQIAEVAAESARIRAAELKRAQRIAGVGSWCWDLQTDIRTWSDETFAIFGMDSSLSPPPLTSVERYFAPGSWLKLMALVERCKQFGEPYQCEAELVRPDGSRRWVVARGEASRADDGGILNINGTLQDVTEHKEAEDIRAEKEALLRATRLKSEFLANMSHELRTPLNAIIGFSEILKDGLSGELTAQQQEYVVDIFNSGEHLLSVINDVLDLSKIEAGKMTLDFEPMSIEELVHACMQIIKDQMLAHHLQLTVEIEPDLRQLLVDARKVKQILYNLLSNAAKFTPEGGVVRLTACKVGNIEVRDGIFDHYLKLTVADTGIGIATKDQQRLFQPFSQIDSEFSRRYQGTGLGLALVKQLVDLHGGQIDLHSAPGEGSIFTVWLPWRVVGDADKRPEATHPVAVVLNENKKRPLALVIEDEAMAANLLSVQLKEGGFRAISVASAEEALELAKNTPPDVIVLDILLPGIDGWEFMEFAKRDNVLSTIPIVIVSIVADKNRGLALGASQVLQKPVTRDALLNALKDIGFNHGREPSIWRVLVVDDSPDDIEITRIHLESAGYQVLVAHGGREGIAIARQICPDLLILDLMMPEVSGFQVVSALQEDESTATIPILVLTAKLLTPDEHAALNGYVISTVEKAAFDGKRFLAEVKRALIKKA